MQNLDLLVNRCMDGWREACDLLRDERLVLEAFYTMHQYVACLATIFSKSECRLAISDDMQESLVGWSVEIIGGAHELLLLVQDDEKALSKISCTVESLVAFLQAVQPIQCTQLIHVLDTIVSWESLPCEKRPLSRLSIASFLSSCSSVEIPEESYMVCGILCLAQDTAFAIVLELYAKQSQFAIEPVDQNEVPFGVSL
ncbi:hypothetical protein BGX20_008276 [Mortierella sp. AD010]|nr:hypothetical protein BGX20_008276 [Mortierella sp. AD010]